MTSVADLIASAAATEQRSRTKLGDTNTFGEPTDITTTCDSKLPTAPWQIDTEPGYGPGASTLDPAPATTPQQGPIPAEYTQASAE
ncbi:MAG: quinolinate synthase NadA, partial [Yaniella sp.]|nr:quinolinate synthase NadA [Yaniella sp.]